MINKNNKNIEIRSFNIEGNETSRNISGYAIVFNSLSRDLGGFREIISPSAVTQDLLDNSDVVMNYAHDDNLILARSRNGEGTLSLTLDERGLKFSFEMPDTSLGNQVLESIRRGDISSCSFAFTMNDEDEIWSRDEEGNEIRTIINITGLYDCAIVTHPAYEETEVSLRSIEKLNDINNMKKDNVELREDDVKDPEEEKEQDVKKEEKAE